MKKFLTLALYALPFMITPAAFAQTGSTAPQDQSSPTAPPTTSSGTSATGGMTATPRSDMGTTRSSAPATMISGLSVKERLLGKDVYNEKDEKIGAIEDVVLTSEGTASTLVVGAGGFLGMGEHNVAVPFNEIKNSGDKLMLSGYTKDQLKALPEVKVAK